jgi:hypothetical protein
VVDGQYHLRVIFSDGFGSKQTGLPAIVAVEIGAIQIATDPPGSAVQKRGLELHGRGPKANLTRTLRRRLLPAHPRCERARSYLLG